MRLICRFTFAIKKYSLYCINIKNINYYKKRKKHKTDIFNSVSFRAFRDEDRAITMQHGPLKKVPRPRNTEKKIE